MSDKREWTAERHAAATARCDAASKGPWTRCGANDANCRCGIVWGHDPIMVASVPYHEDEVGGPIAEEPQRLANWRFIEEARVDLPDALREIERLAQTLGGAHAALDVEIGRGDKVTGYVFTLAERIGSVLSGLREEAKRGDDAEDKVDRQAREIARLKADLLLLGALKSEEVAPVIERFREAFGADVPQAPSGKRALTRDRAREIGLRAMSPSPGRIPEGIVDQVEDAILRAAAGEFGAPCEPAKGDGVGCSREPGCEVEP